jgi:SNF2 family DNA or RNA helicase
MPRVALMLADAVGLGKTIQAGMILRELMLRRRIRRVLILCPASLRTQWRDEMMDKFAMPFEVVDRRRPSSCSGSSASTPTPGAPTSASSPATTT